MPSTSDIDQFCSRCQPPSGKTAGAFAFIRGVIAPEIVIPLHSHADPEVIFVLDGALEILQHNGKVVRWLTTHRGESISILGNKHALRNSSSENTSILLVTTLTFTSSFALSPTRLISIRNPSPW